MVGVFRARARCIRARARAEGAGALRLRYRMTNRDDPDTEARQQTAEAQSGRVARLRDPACASARLDELGLVESVGLLAVGEGVDARFLGLGRHSQPGHELHAEGEQQRDDEAVEHDRYH